MRPVTLTMTGFGTFADAVTVDFDGVEVFALVGPTGSGKSTVVDAMCFALYGSVPRYQDDRVVAPAVHVLATEAKVALEFELGGMRYVAARIVRRDAKGRASTREARLERVGGEPVAGTAKEMTAAVQALLGLDFEQFTRAVVLPQGDFARFLHDKPAARQDLLKQLLGLDVYERMMQRARTRAAEIRAAIDTDRTRLEALAGATPEARAALVVRAGALAEAAAEWSTERSALAALHRAASVADAEVGVAAERVETLQSIRTPDGLAELAAVHATAADAFTVAESAVRERGEAVEAADAAIAAAGDRDGLVRAREDQRTHADLAARLAKAVRRAEQAAAARDRAVTAAAAAAEHVEALRTANAAWVVRSQLEPGRPCPVCEQVVAEVPSGGEPEAWTTARDAARRVRAEADAAVEAATRADADRAALESGRRELVDRLAGVPGPDAVEAALARLDALGAAATVARREEQAARRALAAATEARDDVRRRGQAARASYRDTRDTLRTIGLEPPSESDDLAADWTALLAWVAVEVPEHAAAAAAARTAAAQTRDELDARLAALVSAATGLGLDVAADPSIDGLVTAAGIDAASARDAAARMEADIAERARIQGAMGDCAAEAAVAEQLATLLDARHFEQWLVAEALARLVAGGSARFHELSGGRFSFAFEEGARDLLVVDHGQGDERRSVRTLSGGETFQASLSLALALSDQLADLAADRNVRLESIFLDEGFGTLDAETLETVASTIENLGAVDRMVGIVTHVPELAARMPVQYRVARHGRSATIERVDA